MPFKEFDKVLQAIYYEKIPLTCFESLAAEDRIAERVPLVGGEESIVV